MNTIDNENAQLPQAPSTTEEQLLSSDLADLELKHRRFVNMWISGAYSVRDMSEIFNVNMGTIRAWLRREDVKRAIVSYQKEENDLIKSGLKALRFKALQRMDKLLDSKMENIAYQAAKDILDRTGNKAVTEKKVDVTVTKMENAVDEIYKKLEDAIDVEYIDLDDDE
jgi:IS30 family transposase